MASKQHKIERSKLLVNSGTTAVKDGPAACQALKCLIIKCQLSMVFHWGIYPIKSGVKIQKIISLVIKKNCSKVEN
jgi:hypothetical protein